MPDELILGVGAGAGDAAAGNHAHSSAYVPTPTAWTAPTYSTTWVDYGAPFQGGRYRLRGTDVEIEGLVKSGVSNTSVFTLPVGYRPAADILWIVSAAGGVAEITITTTGLVRPVNITGAVATYVSLTGIRFSTL